MKLLVKSPGMLTTVQDLGRWGYQAIGMPVAGAMDRPALTRGNLVVGNPPGAAALEITLLGPSLEIQGEGLVSLAGADLGMTLNGEGVHPWEAQAVQGGDRLSFSGP
ncbi:MAG: KipI antagonist, partial [Desulfobacterales bacterium]